MPKGTLAKYTIVIPIDEYDQIALAAHQWVTAAPAVQHAHITGPHQDGHHAVKHLVWVSPDNPNADSSAKQLAVHVAEVANVEAIHVLKEGKSGIATWVMRNRSHTFNKKSR